MKIAKQLTFVLLFITLAISLSACSPKSKILGAWESTATGVVLEFMDDGRLLVTTFGITTSGTYEFTDNNKVRLDTPSLLGTTTQTFEVSFNGDALILSSGGIALTFEKVSK